MRKLILLVPFLLPFFGIAQSYDMFIVGDLEGGILTTEYASQETNSQDPIIDGENAHYNIKASLGFMMEWEEMSAVVGLSQNLRFWELQGVKEGNSLRVKNLQNFPSVYLGGFYQFPISSGNVDLHLYAGTSLSADFINYNALNEKSGVTNDYVEASTVESQKVSFNVIPEFGIKGYFKSGNFWRLSARYNLPLTGDIVNGKIEHYRNQTLVETINYKATGQYLAVGLTYGFKMRK